MAYTIHITPSAREDIRFFTVYEQRIIVNGIRTHLTNDPSINTDKRKNLEPNDIAAWELRIGSYRVFYDFETNDVHVIAVGYKEHNNLYIRGRKVEL